MVFPIDNSKNISALGGIKSSGTIQPKEVKLGAFGYGNNTSIEGESFNRTIEGLEDLESQFKFDVKDYAYSPIKENRAFNTADCTDAMKRSVGELDICDDEITFV